jgi:hypothetical protein
MNKKYGIQRKGMYFTKKLSWGVRDYFEQAVI